jgi:Mg2+ and Co2+ transporter CorA
LDHLVGSPESQKRWLQSYKSREDITMNLVFNLVTQQNSETSMIIALDTKDDSATMKIIAVFTIVFLPATGTASFSAMNFFERSDKGTFVSSSEVWIFVVATVPLTFFIFLLWLY